MEQAEAAFAALEHNYFDWNEVRVTTVQELCEVLSTLPDPEAAAERIRKTLHAVFEKLYVFDLEEIRKKNLGQAVEELCQYDGVTPFMCSYATQNVLGGHSIPLDDAAMRVFRVLGLTTRKKTGEEVVTGLERAIPKSKGPEFSRQLHQFASEWMQDPEDRKLLALLHSIDSKAEQRLEQWKEKETTESEREEKEASKKADSEEPAVKKTEKEGGKSPTKSEGRKKAKAATGKEKPSTRKTAKKKSTKGTEEEKPPGKKAKKKKQKSASSDKSKKTSPQKKKKTSTKSKSTKKTPPKKTAKNTGKGAGGKGGSGNRRSPTSKLTRKKPR
jgi:endonuclease III